MAYDIESLQSGERHQLFRNLVRWGFMAGRHEAPEDEDAFWERMGGLPNLGGRPSPYRHDSNANFLIHENDQILQRMANSRKL